MRAKRSSVHAIFAVAGLSILILDAKTALLGATKGVNLCMQTIIPSLFPFFLFSILLTDSLIGIRLPLWKKLGIPKGAESLLVVGLVGGYPVGAQCIAAAHQNGTISSDAARRMLAFCSNAGPGFIFGMGACLFPKIGICWLVWGIHIASALLVGLLTPRISTRSAVIPAGKAISFPGALRKALHVIASVCGWVVIFRIGITFLERWILWLLPKTGQIILYGLLEIANGCVMLSQVEPVGLRLMLFSGFLGFGGFCVSMQTFSVTEGVDTALYLPGKLTQCAISLLFSIAAQLCLPATERVSNTLPVLLICLTVCAGYWIIARKTKKFSSNPAAISV